MNALREYLELDQNFGFEYHVPLQMELSFAPLSDVAEPSPHLIAIYRYQARNVYGKYIYRFDGVRIIGLPNKSVQPTAFGVGKRGHLANLLVSLGKYLIKIGGG